MCDEPLDRIAEIARITAPYEGNTPRSYKDDWRRPFERAPSGPLRLFTFAYEYIDPLGQVIVLHFPSMNFIAALPETEENAVAAQLRELIASHSALKGKEQVALPYRTKAYLAEACQAYCPTT